MARLEHWSRTGLWLALLVFWAVAVYYMWDALTTVPGPERLEETRMAAIPTPRTFAAAVAFSAMELAVVLAALWPWRTEYYATRMGLALLVMATWFVTTTPMQLSRMDWVHRRWLGLTILVLAVALMVVLVGRLAARVRELAIPTRPDEP